MSKFETKPTYATFTPNVKVYPGEQFTIFAIVENTGDAGGSVEVRVKNINGEILAKQAIYIEAGGKARVEFTLTAPSKPGWHPYYVEHFNLTTGRQDWIHLVGVHVIPRDVRITIDVPDRVKAGEAFKAKARVEYFDGSRWLPLNATVSFWVDYVLSRDDVLTRLKYASATNGEAIVDLKIDSTGVHYVCAGIENFSPLEGWYGLQNLRTCKKIIVESQQAPVATQTPPKPIQPTQTQPTQTTTTRSAQSPTSIMEQLQNPPPAIVFKKTKRPELLIPV